MSNLVLGSANFGMEYGLSNNFSQVSSLDVHAIMKVAEVAGIQFIDTAQSYGNSEERLGDFCQDAHFEIISKIFLDILKGYQQNELTNLVKLSCLRVRRPKLHAVLLHRPEVLLSAYGSAIIRELYALKEQGIVSKIGISIYSTKILEDIFNQIKIDIIQVPFNLFDQQVSSSGWAQKLREHGVEIHTRSTFLQGLLLLPRCEVPSYFLQNWPNLFASWYDFLHSNKTDAVTVALKFALNQVWVDKVVVGADTPTQLSKLIEIEKSNFSIDFPSLSCDDANLINPSNWKLS